MYGVKKIQTHTFLIVALLFCGDLLAGQLLWQTYFSNIRDSAGNPLPAGSLIQLIDVGGDGINNPATYFRDGTTGDDEVVQVGAVSAGGTFFGEFSGALTNHFYFVRAWSGELSGELPFQNSNVPNFPTLYNDSAIIYDYEGYKDPPSPWDVTFYFDGASGWATTKTALPAPGSSVALTVTKSGTSPLLSWTAAGGATSYRVYRTSTNTAPSAGDKIHETSLLSYTDSSPGSGTFYYWVEPVNGDLSGGVSASIAFRKIVAMPWLNLLLD
jgi:hypothetical protein